jgi:hypothetical protein
MSIVMGFWVSWKAKNIVTFWALLIFENKPHCIELVYYIIIVIIIGVLLLSPYVYMA